MNCVKVDAMLERMTVCWMGGIIPVLEYVCKAAGLPIMEGITKHNMKQLLHETCAINDAGYVSHSHQPPYSHSQCIK